MKWKPTTVKRSKKSNGTCRMSAEERHRLAGDCIGTLRTREGWTQKRINELFRQVSCGVPVTTLSKWLCTMESIGEAVPSWEWRRPGMVAGCRWPGSFGGLHFALQCVWCGCWVPSWSTYYHNDRASRLSIHFWLGFQLPKTEATEKDVCARGRSADWKLLRVASAESDMCSIVFCVLPFFPL